MAASNGFPQEAPSLDDSGYGASPVKNQRVSPAHFIKTSPLNSSDANGDHVTTACIQASEPQEPFATPAYNSAREMEELRRRVQYLEIEVLELRQKLETFERSKVTGTESTDKTDKSQLEAELEYSRKMYKHTREVEESHAKRMKLMEEKLESLSKLPQPCDAQLLQHDTQPHDAQLSRHGTKLLQHAHLPRDTQIHRQLPRHQGLLFDKPKEENKSPNTFLPTLRESKSCKKDKRPISAKF